jgi:hypothetical protein
MKIILSLLLILSAISTRAQYNFYLISRSPYGGDSLYVWSQKQNSNSWLVADFIAGSSNRISELELRSGLTNWNFLLLSGRLGTNESNLTTLSNRVNTFISTNAPQYYSSNTWSLFSATNGMANGAFKLVNSNGAALISVWLSNGVPILKPLQP